MVRTVFRHYMPIQTINSMKNVCYVAGLLTLFVCSTLGQKPNCEIGEMRFECPSEYFKAIESRNSETRIFKYMGAGNNLFFFMSVPNGSFDPAMIGGLVQKAYPTATTEHFEWITEADPLVMNTDTKQKYDLVASLGLSETRLWEVKGFKFKINGKQIVLGYLSDWTEDGVTNKRRFQQAKGFADNAAACNAVVTALNSVTHEFKEPKQYCSLSTSSAPK